MNVYVEIELKVEYDYESGERAHTTGLPENCYPGTAASLDINSVTYNGKEIKLTAEDMEKAEQWILEEVENEEDPHED